MDMTSNKPYLVRAFYEWIVDNNLTPYLVVNATVRGVKVPQQHVQNGQIVLNITPSAIGNLQMGDDFISFNARFGGQPFALSVPVKAVLAIYARENGAGTMFEAELDEEEIDVDLELDDELPEPSEPTPPAAKKVSHLKVIK